MGPIWKGGLWGEELLLKACYRNVLKLAIEFNCTTIAIPLISSGSFRYPADQVMKVAVDAITEMLIENDIMVYLVVYKRKAHYISKKLFSDITNFINDKYEKEKFAVQTFLIDGNTHDTSKAGNEYGSMGNKKALSSAKDKDLEEQEENLCPIPDDDYLYASTQLLTYEEERKREKELEGSYFQSLELNREYIPCEAGKPEETTPIDDLEILDQIMASAQPDLDLLIRQMDESFTQMLLRKIDEKGMTDVQCYKKANIDRKLFSKIRSNLNYTPRKNTVIAFAISLELNLDETKDILNKAGYALSHSNKFDIIVEYFIRRGIYDVYRINEALFAFDQNLIGG